MVLYLYPNRILRGLGIVSYRTFDAKLPNNLPMLLDIRKDNYMDALQQVKLDKIENLLQVLVNLLDKKATQSLGNYNSKRSSKRIEYIT